MNGSSAWRDVKYTEVFEQELRGLERLRNFDSSCTVNDLVKVLDNLYIMDGAEGSSDLQNTVMAATIAAHEHFIAQWKSEIKR